MGTVRDYFDTDFKRDVVETNTFFLELAPEGSRFAVPARIHLDFDSNAMFVCVYLPSMPDPIAFFRGLGELVDRLLAKRRNSDVSFGKADEPLASGADLKFAGRVFVYAEDDLPPDQLPEIAASLRTRDLYLRFRGPQYARARSAHERPLAFISYDSSDRDIVARPLATALAGLRCPTWFDEYAMRAGDDIERHIEKGLNECERCIVVLSERYLANQRWARREFEAISARETHERRALMIPIRHGVTEQQVAQFSRTLADRRSIEWAPERVQEIAHDLEIVLKAVGRPDEWELAWLGRVPRRWHISYRVGYIVGRLVRAVQNLAAVIGRR
jgi:hypothetical protein